METKDLITMIDTAALKAQEMPEGFVYIAPSALVGIPAKQMLELADHYGIEPTMDTVGRAELSIGGRSLSIKATSEKLQSARVVNAREVLNASLSS